MMRLLVVGGGVAGSAVALAARRADLEAVVLERRDRLDPQEGSWITLAPNGLDALDRLGVLDAARGIGHHGRTNRMFGATGRLLGEVPLGTPLADGTVALTMKRSAIATLLADEAVAAGVELRLGSVVDDVVDRGRDGVEVRLGGGDTVTGDLVVGADGVRSRVRTLVDPAAPSARYLGLTNFGGLTRATPVASRLAPEAWHFVFGHRCFTGAFPLPGGDVVWFANVPRPEIGREERGSTSASRWSQWLAGLTEPDAGPMTELVTTGVLELAGDNTYDLARVPTWRGPATVLVGDAVHAPSPSSGQGAAMALEDAVVLVGALVEHGLDGPARYEAARRRRVEGIVRAGARTSSAKVPGPVGRRVLEAGLRAAAASGVMTRQTLRTTAHRLDAHLLTAR
jgi:2-polyprenyl-6-methoxyphenol hydroxylase-like FAD-dependent oxidoreductase